MWPPDWTKPQQYPDPNNTTALQWAWEFLRRNPKYQKLWDQTIKPRYNAAHLDYSWNFASGVHPRRGVRGRRRLKPIPLKNRFFPTANPLPAWLAKFRTDFHILTYPPPPSENIAKLFFDGQFIHYDGPAGTPRGVSRPLERNEIVLWFNLTWPLKSQLDNAKKLLEHQAAKIKTKGFRSTATHYRKYLRVLDAKAAGIGEVQILNTLYPNLSNAYPNKNARQTLRDDVKAAELLRDNNFWLIAATTQN